MLLSLDQKNRINDLLSAWSFFFCGRSQENQQIRVDRVALLQSIVIYGHRKGGPGDLAPLDFKIWYFSIKVLTKKVVFLFRAGKMKFHHFGPPLEKSFWPYLEKILTPKSPLAAMEVAGKFWCLITYVQRLLKNASNWYYNFLKYIQQKLWAKIRDSEHKYAAFMFYHRFCFTIGKNAIARRKPGKHVLIGMPYLCLKNGTLQNNEPYEINLECVTILDSFS